MCDPRESNPSMASPLHSFTKLRSAAAKPCVTPERKLAGAGSTGEELGFVEDHALVPEVIDGASQLGG